MNELVLPYLRHIKTELSDSFIDVRVVLRLNLCRVWNFTNTLYSENCDKYLMSEGPWHVLHVIVTKRKDEQFVKQWVLNVVVNFRIHTTACEFYLHERSAFGKPG